MTNGCLWARPGSHAEPSMAHGARTLTLTLTLTLTPTLTPTLTLTLTLDASRGRRVEG